MAALVNHYGTVRRDTAQSLRWNIFMLFCIQVEGPIAMSDRDQRNSTDKRNKNHRSAPDKNDADVGSDKDQMRQSIEESTDPENLAKKGKESKERTDEPQP